MTKGLAAGVRLTGAGALVVLCGLSAALGPPSDALAATPPPASDLLPKALKGPMAGVQDIIYAARAVGADPHWYANISYYAEDENRKTYMPGGRLCRMNLKTGQVKVLLEDMQGNIRDPHVHYNGKKILFSWRKGGTDHYHLYEIGADGSGLRQLTRGDYDDYEAIYLPDDDILFVSTRCKRWVNCWLTQVGILYRCGPNGENIHPISSNADHDNTPWLMPDGRVLYMRWEYTDRSQVHYHHLWTVNPDGTGQMVYFGNMHGGVVMIDAKPIPGTDRVLSIFSPGHGRREHAGRVTIVDPDAGPDAQPYARDVNAKPVWRDPYPFSEDCILLASPRGIELMDGKGRTQLLQAKTGDMELHEPRPLVARERERLVPPRRDLRQAMGRFVMADVTHGRNMVGVKDAEITKLLILEVLPEPVHFHGGMTPLTLGGTFMLERILGTVPVEPDGSAYFEVPAMRSVFFVAMDKNDDAVKRMHSFVTVQPGETTGCIGCHEQRSHTRPPPAVNLAATRRRPSRIQPVADVPEVFDFPRDIQPILDKHCVKCHNPEKRAGGFSLAGDRGPTWSHSYANLTYRKQFVDGRNLALGSRPPRSVGAVASPIMKKLAGGHNDVKATPHEVKMVRYWIESGAVYPGTYGAVGTGMIARSIQNKAVLHDTDWPETKAAGEVIRRRCASCHQGKMHLQGALHQSAPGYSRDVVFNLSRPEKSFFLLGPLAKKAGGYGTCQAKAKPPKGQQAGQEVFVNTKDADYQKLLAWIRRGQRFLETENKRFDMDGFRPGRPYIREMKRYGILAKTLGPDDPVDPYATDRAYWESFWHRPVQ
ncbi:MAG TPA: hypothetical protein VM238_14170 [Phycisphaerae bacterium]|nr:hypothetical protein [Phycisphaerae bacterium]